MLASLWTTASSTLAQSGSSGNDACPNICRFKAENSLVKRQVDSERVRQKFPGRVPVIIGARSDSRLPAVGSTKYLVPDDLTVGQFVYIVRRRTRLPPEQAMFLFVRNVLPACSITMADLDEEYKDEDGFLYINYSSENTFG